MTTTANETATEEVLSRSQAVKLTGFSVAKFKSNKIQNLLTEHGADLTPTEPKDWKIPVSALVKAGMLTADGSPVPHTPRAPRSKATTRVVGGDLADLHSAIAEYDARIADLSADLAELKSIRKAAASQISSAEKAHRRELEKAAAAARRAEEKHKAEAEALEEQLANL